MKPVYSRCNRESKSARLRNRTIAAIVVGIVLGGSALSSNAQETAKVRVWIEKALSPSGPWEEVDLETIEKDAKGNPIFPAGGQEFFRTGIERFAGDGSRTHTVPIGDVPKLYVDLAQNFLNDSRDGNSANDAEGWPEDAALAPFVLQMSDVSGDGATNTGYLEFKVIRPSVPKPGGESGFTDSPDEGLAGELGYLLISLSDTDFPIAEYATSGKTACEDLMERAKGKAARVVRFGPTFSVAEDAEGNPLATQGAAPFQVDPLVLDTDGFEWIGDDLRGTQSRPDNVPDLRAGGYRSYAEFKKEFANGETYTAYRKVRATRAKTEWDALRGKGNPALNIVLGRSELVFPELFGRQRGDFLLVTDKPGFIDIEEQATGGLKIAARLEGEGLLRVRDAAGNEDTLFVSAVPGRAARDVGDVTQEYFYAGNWASQPKYHQTTDSDWCNKVGCGPAAWGILLAWFDRNNGVEWAFQGEPDGQLPPEDTTTASRRAAVHSAYDELHELCDVICPPFSDQGATYPPDMTEGILGYTHFSSLAHFINRSWHTNSITGTWPDAGALRCRDAIKNGYPAVVGLGWLWHYAVAYGYSYKTVELNLGYKVTTRYLKCNMGWGPDTDPRWYNMLDTFYAANVKITKGANAQ